MAKRGSDPRVAYPEVKLQVWDLMRVVGIVAPFAPRWVCIRRKFILSSRRGKWAQQTSAGCPQQRLWVVSCSLCISKTYFPSGNVTRECDGILLHSHCSLVKYLPDRHKHFKQIRGWNSEKLYYKCLYIRYFSVVIKIYFHLGAPNQRMRRDLIPFPLQSWKCFPLLLFIILII